MGNQRNSFQGMITVLMGVWNIFRFLFEGITSRRPHIEHLKICQCLIPTAKKQQYCKIICYTVEFTHQTHSFTPNDCAYLLNYIIIYIHTYLPFNLVTYLLSGLTLPWISGGTFVSIFGVCSLISHCIVKHVKQSN